jgi:pullulanase/glycogen debranching enzyme
MSKNLFFIVAMAAISITTSCEKENEPLVVVDYLEASLGNYSVGGIYKVDGFNFDLQGTMSVDKGAGANIVLNVDGELITTEDVVLLDDGFAFNLVPGTNADGENRTGETVDIINGTPYHGRFRFNASGNSTIHVNMVYKSGGQTLYQIQAILTKM